MSHDFRQSERSCSRFWIFFARIDNVSVLWNLKVNPENFDRFRKCVGCFDYLENARGWISVLMRLLHVILHLSFTDLRMLQI